MRILILTQYFPPETGAPQNRLHSLAGYFSDLGAEVSILTAMPNYPKMEVFEAYSGKAYKFETDKNLKILFFNEMFFFQLLNKIMTLLNP